MVQSKASIKRSIKKLRTIIDGSKNDPIRARIAYAVENALRWAIEDIVGWERPEEDVIEETDICKRELRIAKL